MFIFRLLKQKRVQSGTKSIACRFCLGEKKLKESVYIGVAGLKQDDNIKMDLMVANLKRWIHLAEGTVR